MNTVPKVGHVQRSIDKGTRPFLTATVAPETFRALDRLAAYLGISRGRTLDIVIAAAEREGIK